jgi:DNA-directed RNA polymerase subunit RPC12/RpoP
MLGFIVSLIVLVIALYGYYLTIKQSALEKELRKNKLDYHCFKCKEIISINDLKCPKCAFITIYGKRKKSFWLIFPIIGIWFFVLLKFNKTNMF